MVSIVLYHTSQLIVGIRVTAYGVASRFNSEIMGLPCELWWDFNIRAHTRRRRFSMFSIQAYIMRGVTVIGMNKTSKSYFVQRLTIGKVWCQDAHGLLDSKVYILLMRWWLWYIRICPPHTPRALYTMISFKQRAPFVRLQIYANMKQKWGGALRPTTVRNQEAVTFANKLAILARCEYWTEMSVTSYISRTHPYSSETIYVSGSTIQWRRHRFPCA